MSSSKPKIKSVEVCGLFWDDLEKWRTHPKYWKIRDDISNLIQAAGRGDPTGEKPFGGLKTLWKGINHTHVSAKLIVFTARDGDTMRLCAMKKHAFYGFKNEGTSKANKAAQVIRNAIAADPVPSPEWKSLSWKDPGILIDNPELPELSRDGLEGLYHEVLEEADTLERMERAMAKADLSPAMEEAFAESWVEALIKAQECVEAEIIAASRRRKPKAMKLAHFDDWSEKPEGLSIEDITNEVENTEDEETPELS